MILHYGQVEVIPGIQDYFNFENQSMLSIVLINQKKDHFTKCK